MSVDIPPQVLEAGVMAYLESRLDSGSHKGDPVALRACVRAAIDAWERYREEQVRAQVAELTRGEISSSQHCTAVDCYTFSHTASWCRETQPRRCECRYCDLLYRNLLYQEATRPRSSRKQPYDVCHCSGVFHRDGCPLA